MDPISIATLAALFLPQIGGPTVVQDAVVTRAVPLPTPPPRAKTTWDYSRSQVIERLVERLRGASSLRAWRFSKEVLARACDDEEVQQALIQYLERGLLTKGEDAPARNAMEVMRRSKNPVFSPVLMRATRHSIRTLSEEAMAGLASCASADAVEKLLERFDERYLRSQVLVLRVVAQRGAPEIAVPFFRKLLDGQITLKNIAELTASLLEVFDKLDRPEIVRGALTGKLSLFPKSAGELAAKLLHVAGAEEGRFALLRALEVQEDPVRRAGILDALSQRDPEASLDAVLGLVAESKHPVERLALARYLGRIPDDSASEANLVAMLEVLASDDIRDVELEALQALRGRSKPTIDRLLSRLGSAEGSELRQLLEACMRARDPRAVPIVAQRLEQAEGAGRQIYVQTLGRMGIAASVPHLERVLRGPSLNFGREVDSIAYAAIVTTNIFESESMLWGLRSSLDPEDPQQLAVRSHALKTLANLAKAPGPDEEARLARIQDGFRKIVFDPAAPPRERLQCLDYLRGGTLEIADALRLGRKMRRDADFAPEALRGSFNDFLTEFF